MTRTAERRWTAALECGHLLEYDAPDLVPVIGDVVPCRRHGYCPVAQAITARAERRRRPAPRTTPELVDHLRPRGSATLAALRQQRFPLRVVTEAERAGLVHLDLLAGTVELAGHPGQAHPSPAGLGTGPQTVRTM